MLYLIGLGLNVEGISKLGLQVIKRCKKIYLESYTVEFPYSIEELRKVFGKKIISINREFIESMNFVDEAKKIDIALLVYGSPLIATTHISLIQEAKKKKINFKIIHNASILDAISETGLQIYKFGKIASLPEFEADSFMKVVQDNQSINAHSLILIDIGLSSRDSLEKLEKACKKYKTKLDKILVCSRLGTKNSKIFYDKIKTLKKKKIQEPYCFIIPSKLHFIEKEILEWF